MSSLSTFKPDSDLNAFEGQEVVKTSVAFTNAGDALSQALAVDPAEWQLGDTVFVVLRTDCTKVSYQPVKGEEDTLNRVHTLRATDAAVIDASIVQRSIDEQRERIRLAREAAHGIQRLPVSEPPAGDEFD